MPFTFSTDAFTKPMAEFGNDAAAMILQTGEQISQGLQKMMTNRQVAGFATEISQLDPSSPEWPKLATQIGARYPLAMKSPGGQMAFAPQLQAHTEWTRTQRATQEADTMMRRQIGMENLRTANDIKLEEVRAKNRMARSGDELVPLDGPAQPVPRNPAQGISLETGGMSGAAQGAMNAASPEEGALLTGMRGSLPDISEMSPAERAKAEFAKIGPAASRKGLERFTIQNAAADERRALAGENQKAIAARAKMGDDLRREQLAFRKETDQIKNDFAAEKFDYTKLKDKVGVLQKQRDNMVKMLENSKKAGKIGPESDAEAQLATVEAMDAALSELAGLENTAIFKTEEQARKAGKQAGDEIMMINPATGKPQRAKLK